MFSLLLEDDVVVVVEVAGENGKLKGSVSSSFHSTCRLMGHEDGDNKGKPRDSTCKAYWTKQTLQ